MRRLAVLAAAVFVPAVHAAGPDLPTPTGAQTAPVLPQVPRPLLNGETLVPGEAGRAEVAPPAQPVRSRLRPTVRVEPGEGQPAASRWSVPSPNFTRTTQAAVEPSDPTAPAGLPGRGANGGAGATAITTPPAKPTLPAPAAVPAAPVQPAPAAPGCVTADCATGTHGGCWSHCKNWLCFHQTRVWLGCHPTPYVPPFHTQFLCQEKGLCGPAGCNGPGCVAPAGGHAAVGPTNGATNGAMNPVPGSDGPTGVTTATAAPARPGLGARLFGRRTEKEKEKVEPGWATAGQTVPGYRLATPENPSITGKGPVAVPLATPLVGTSYRAPADPSQR